MLGDEYTLDTPVTKLRLGPKWSAELKGVTFRGVSLEPSLLPEDLPGKLRHRILSKVDELLCGPPGAGGASNTDPREAERLEGSAFRILVELIRAGEVAKGHKLENLVDDAKMAARRLRDV